MRYKNVLFQLVCFVLLFTLPTALMAQEQLTQTFTSADGMFTMSYPEGWSAEEEDGLIRFSSDQAFVQVNYYDYGEDVTPQEVLEIGAATYLGFTPPQNLVVGGYAAVQASGEDQFHTVINFCDGIMALFIGYVQPGDMATYAPTFMAMLDTIQYGDSGPVLCQGTFDSLQPITSGNAAQVAQFMTLGDETASITSVSFSTDGNLLAAGALDGTVWIWSTVTGEERLNVDAGNDGATSVALDLGGYNLAVGTGGGQVRLWDATFGDGMGFLQEHDGAVESVAFDFTGLFVASGGDDGRVLLWSLVDASEQALPDNTFGMPVQSVAFSPDGSILAAGGGSTIRVWDVFAGSVRATLETDLSEITSLSFSPDGASLVYAGSEPGAWVWNLADDNRILIEGDADPVSGLAFSPDGQIIASAEAGTVSLWDAATGANLNSLTSPSTQIVNSLAFSPNGSVLAAGGDSGGVVLWGTAAAVSAAQEATASESSGETTEAGSNEETTTSVSSCTVSAPNNANLRSGPGTEFDRAGSLTAGQTAEVDGQAQGADGMTWYRLTDGSWVRSDIVAAPEECGTVPTVTP